MGPTVLLSEGDEACAAALLRVMRRLGVTVERVGTGREALARLSEGGIDLLVLDLGLPDLDGSDVCRLSRSAGYAGNILALSTRHDAEVPGLALRAGADDFMPKPFTVSDLEARARALLG